ncbi:hypothetical protein D6777_03975 [Candidatus Woesearchaeota archaeon]|nr:MAG: hypothetical protein D6777_03975 [Candidatus Woesearchaeota archaeon]
MEEIKTYICNLGDLPQILVIVQPNSGKYDITITLIPREEDFDSLYDELSLIITLLSKNKKLQQEFANFEISATNIQYHIKGYETTDIEQDLGLLVKFFGFELENLLYSILNSMEEKEDDPAPKRPSN